MTGVGADFGTSNSAVAYFDGEQLRYVTLDGASPILPTAVHLNRSFAALTGSAAVEQYVEENRGRLVELVPEAIGVAATEISGARLGESDGEQEDNRNTVYGQLYDRGQPGRLFLGLKRLLGDAGMDRLTVFSRAFRLVALMTPVLQRMREGVQQVLGRPAETVHVGRPVNFEGRDPQRNEVALARLGEAGGYAGIRNIHFYPEPIAATLSYLWRARPDKPGIALTVDFGGGTLDLSVIRYRGAEQGTEQGASFNFRKRLDSVSSHFTEGISHHECWRCIQSLNPARESRSRPQPAAPADHSAAPADRQRRPGHRRRRCRRSGRRRPGCLRAVGAPGRRGG